ncbi:MAG: PH domain-containing protein [Sphingorhabdus sp.]
MIEPHTDAPAVPDDAAIEEERHKLHPLGLLVNFIAGLPQLILPIAAVLFAARKNADFGSSLVIPIIAAVLLISLFFRWLAWTRFRYIIGEEDIRIESGILNRNARSIPFERIQDLSIEQRLLARIMGLGEVKFETGSGEGDEGKLSFVTVDEGERLRELIRDRKEGAATGGKPAPTKELPEGTLSFERDNTPPIFAMNARRVLTLGLFEFSLVIFAVLLGISQQFEFLLPFDLWDVGSWIGVVDVKDIDLNAISWTARIVGIIAALGSLILVGMATGVIRTFIREYGFRLDRTAKGFRRRRGLTTLTDVVMPVHRVQAAIVQTGLIRKRFGWHALKFVSLAQDSKEEASHVVAPLAKLDDIWPIAGEAKIHTPADATVWQKPSAKWWFDQWLMVTPLIGAGIIALMVFTDAGMKALLPLSLALFFAVTLFLDWRSRFHARDDSQLYARQGWWRPRLTIAPQVKVQSVDIHQGPIARMRGLAKLKFGIAGGDLEIDGIPVIEARAIRDQVLAEIVQVDFAEVNRAS